MKTQPIAITDLPARVVGGFTPAAGIGEGWVDWTWETSARTGTGLAVGGATRCEPLTLALNLTGPHRLYLGLGGYSVLRVWVDGMVGYRRFWTMQGHGLQRCELWVEDLTDKRLHIANESRVFDDKHNVAAFLAYIEAEPGATPCENHRNIVGTDDGLSYLMRFGYDAPADTAARILPLRESDVGRMLFGPAGADLTTAPGTIHGTFVGGEPTHAARHICRQKYRALETIRKRGDDPLAIAGEACRTLGVEFHIYIRVEAFAADAWKEKQYRSDFFTAHPQWRCVDEDGDTIDRLSYAYPGVREHMLAYFEELLQYDPDGLCLAFNRSLPMILFEEPVLNAFEERYGRRPDLPAEAFTPEMLAVRHDLLEAFLQAVHALYAGRGKALSFIAGGDATTAARFGVDIRRLAQTGWFQAIYGVNARDPFWRDLKQTTGVEIYPDGRVWGPAHEHTELARYARDEIFGAGFDGLFFWDICHEFQNPYDWHAVRRIGTPAWRDGILDGSIPPPPLDEVVRINGVKLGPYSPGRSY